MNNVQRVSLLRQIEKEIKLGVIIIDIFMTLYVLWLILTNTSTWLVGVVFGYTPLGVFWLFKASKLFNLCYIHKSMLMHTTLVYGCCVWQAQYGFGDYLYIARWTMFLTGFLLIQILLYKLINKQRVQ